METVSLGRKKSRETKQYAINTTVRQAGGVLRVVFVLGRVILIGVGLFAVLDDAHAKTWGEAACDRYCDRVYSWIDQKTEQFKKWRESRSVRAVLVPGQANGCATFRNRTLCCQNTGEFIELQYRGSTTPLEDDSIPYNAVCRR